MDTFNKLKAMAKETAVQVGGSPLEKKIMEACANKPWGASTTMMSELAQATYDYQEYPVVMAGVWKRMGERGALWRVCYKSLCLLEYLICNGSERAVEDARDHMYQLRSLGDFQYSHEGTDHGINVREKSRKICELLNDRARLKEEREKARANRGKYGGVSSMQVGHPPHASAGLRRAFWAQALGRTRPLVSYQLPAFT